MTSRAKSSMKAVMDNYRSRRINRTSRFSIELTADAQKKAKKRKQKKSTSLMRLYEMGTQKTRTHACPSLQPPFSPDRLNVRHPRVRSNGNSARHCSFSIFRLLMRATVLEALHRDAVATVAATVQRTNEQGALATFAAINTGLTPAAGINSRWDTRTVITIMTAA